MRPRQILRDFLHNTTPPSQSSSTYQSENQSVALSGSIQPMGPPPMPSMPAASAPPTSQPSQPTSLPHPELFAQLLRLGLNPDDLVNQSSIRPQVREEVVKNLQAILGKKDSADLLRKLMPLQNDWSNTSAPDYQRGMGGNTSGSGGGGNKDNILNSSILSGAGGGTSGTMSFTDHIINGNSSQQQEQDVQYANAQQQQLRQAVASSVNHHQHFRVPTTSSAMHNSPSQQQQQMLSQHKSVLSLHHQQHPLAHPHQADPANRQRLNQQHKLNSVPNSSLANLNDMSGGASSSISSSNPALLDPKNSSIFNHRTSPAIGTYTLPSAGTTPRVPNIMDAIGGQPGLDNMHDNSPLQQSITMNSRDKLKSMAKHQQMLKQFRKNADKHKNLSWPNPGGPSSNLNLGSESLTPQRMMGSNINHGNGNNIGLSQLQRQLTSPISTAISPPQTAPGLPKSLLNLAACSTSPPYTNSTNQLSSNSRIANQMSSIRGVNINQSGNNGQTTAGNSRATVRQDVDNTSGQRSASVADPKQIMLQQIMSRSSNNKNASSTATRSNYSNFSLSSLLLDDQSKNNSRSQTNQNNSAPNLKPNYQSNQLAHRRPSSAKSDDLSLQQTNFNDRDNHATSLAYLQDRTTKASAGQLSVTRFTQSRDIAEGPSQLQSVLMSQPELSETNDESQGDIESAISRVEARNDLSLLYPPVSLASNSQKQINSLSAGIPMPDEVDMFTDEIKKIVQEGCNIIYECKTCSNLFRSLANLVKHKRLYCKENKNKAAQLELTRRSNINPLPTLDMSVTKNSRDSIIGRPATARDVDESETSLLADTRPKHLDGTSISSGSQKYNLRGKRVDVSFLVGGARSTRSTKHPERPKETAGQNSPNAKNYTDNLESSSGQTYLSRLLQSQPRNRVSPMKDSALMDALSIAPALPASRNIINNNTIGKFNEQLVRNSSLAKTLLSENVKSINVNQSNSETTNTDNLNPSNQRYTSTPKRKLLEDCISKVKRDKLGPSESASCDSTLAENQNSPVPSQTSPAAVSQDESEPYKDPLDINDSGGDSDVLIMDDGGDGNDEEDNENVNEAAGQNGSGEEDEPEVKIKIEGDVNDEPCVEGDVVGKATDGDGDIDVDCDDQNADKNQETNPDAEVDGDDVNDEGVEDNSVGQDDADVKDGEIATPKSDDGDRDDDADLKVDDDDDDYGDGGDKCDQDAEEDEDDEEDVDDEDDGNDEEDDGDDGDDEDNDENEEDDDEDDEGDDSDAGEQTIAVIKSERKSSYCGSTRSESDLNPSEIRDKISKQKYYDNATSHSSSKSSSKPSTASTPDGTGGCKLILKTALSSSRDGGGGSSASTSSSGAASSSSGGGSIMKVKIQLKTQPDEKSKVYRIVE